jgi:acyl dehydratase
MTAPLRYFEDYEVGATYELGRRTVGEAEIVAFARDFDPQPFHVDREAATRSPFGGLIASGWHTCAICMRMIVDSYLSPETSLGSPGVEQLKWLNPVRPGDTLVGRMQVVEKRPSRSRPEIGLLLNEATLVNQKGEAVLSLRATNMVRRKKA